MPNQHLISSHPNFVNSFLLFVSSLANYALMYGANVLLARTLDVGDFDDYSVAVSLVTMLSTLATLGLEKFALRAIPVFRERQDWSSYFGFWQFSLRTIIAFSFLLTLILAVSLEAVLAMYQSDYHIAIVVYAGFLPIIAASLFMVEFQSAHGAHLLSVAIYRVLLPVLYLFFLFILSISLARMTALIAVLCYGMAWSSIALLMWRLSVIFMPAEKNRSRTETDAVGWLKVSLPLVMNSLMMTIMTSSGVVILEILFPSGVEVGIYAAAAQTGGFISLIGTSTNRYYLPKMVVLSERRNKVSIEGLIKERVLVVGGMIVSILAMIYLFGEAILGLFGRHFQTGYDTLLIIATGAAISALYADIPYYLQFMEHKRLVFYATLSAVAAMVGFSFILGSLLGIVGVALAYTIPVTLLFIGLRLVAGYFIGRL